MPYSYRYSRPTIGVLAGWQFYRTATNLSYLLPVFRGISRAAQDLGCNLLLGCGMGASASPDDMAGDTGERLKAYQSALAGFGLESDSRIVAFGRHVFDSGYSSMRQIIDSVATFTAVLASNDESALGAMVAIKEAGRKIPDEVAIIRFDNRLEGAAHGLWPGSGPVRS
jgi:DNA-binding LacI/PurR family transcriptional regulator